MNMNLSDDKNLEKKYELNDNNTNTVTNTSSNVVNTNSNNNSEEVETINLDNIFTNEDNIKGFNVTKEELDSVAKLNEIYNTDVEVL